jgi:dTDP-4-amino-4,6-dideoxygalactose transaminase
MRHLLRARSLAPADNPARRQFIPSLPTLDPAQLWPASAPPHPPPFPLDRLGSPATQRFYLARAGVYQALRHWLAGAPPQDPEIVHSHNKRMVQPHNIVLMPAYHHGVEVEAARAAGARIVFYRVDGNMRLDLDDLARKAARPGVGVVYVTHFVGFAQPIAEVRKIVQLHNIRLFEDCALALFSRRPDGAPLGGEGDACCFCLYKTLPVPHGGLLLAPGVPAPRLRPPPLLSTLHHLAGLTLAHLALRSAGLGRAVRQAARAASRATVDRAVATVQTGTMHLGAHELDLGVSRVLAPLLARVDAESLVLRRRRNFARMAAALDGVLPVVGAPLQPGVCPLFVPVRVDGERLGRRGLDKRALLGRLRARGIDAVDFWRSGDAACDPAEFPEVTRLRREILELPCHQSLDDDAIDRVARAVKQALVHA